MELFQHVLDGSLMPHGQCLLWRPDLLFLHITGETLTFISYFAIPTALIYLVRRRADMEFDWIFYLFAAFILLCGITHLITLINIWHGYYFIEGLAKLSTGVVSMLTAVMVWRLMPKALAIPSNAELMETNRELALAQQQLRIANQTLEEKVALRTRELEQMATIDPLTGIYNRGILMQELEKEMERSRRYDEPLSVLMIDLDHFKQVNDRHGHLTGDRVLKDAAHTFARLCRTPDTLGRYGGEEFLLILPNTDTDDAVTFAERLRGEIENRHIDTPDATSISYTCSVGVTRFRPEQNTEVLLHAADQALYKAKFQGRNQVQVYRPE